MNVLFRLALVGTMLILIWKFILPRKGVVETAAQAKADSMQYVIDSLNNEVFIHSANVVRYEIALGMLAETDSVAAAKFEEQLNTLE